MAVEVADTRSPAIALRHWRRAATRNDDSVRWSSPPPSWGSPSHGTSWDVPALRDLDGETAARMLGDLLPDDEG